MSISGMSLTESVFMKEKFLLVIERKISTFENYEQVRKEYRTIGEHAKSMNFTVNHNMVSSLDDEAKNHFSGKRMLETLRKFIEGDTVLRYIVEEDVDLSLCRAERNGDPGGDGSELRRQMCVAWIRL